MKKPVVLITGALTGIARAAALAFAKDGVRLVVSGRSGRIVTISSSFSLPARPRS
jgi:NAD(P)-dependent dehydrogenase (short-subunit alcohol dehydrogenase family)